MKEEKEEEEEQERKGKHQLWPRWRRYEVMKFRGSGFNLAKKPAAVNNRRDKSPCDATLALFRGKMQLRQSSSAAQQM